MTAFSETAMEQYGQAPWPDYPDMSGMRDPYGYWEERRREIAQIVSHPDMTDAGKIEEILTTEATSPTQYAHRCYLTLRRLAAEAVLADLQSREIDAERAFQHLIELETGEASLSEGNSHANVARAIAHGITERAKDGKILRLEFTNPAGAFHERRLVDATAYWIDSESADPVFFVLDRSGGAQSETYQRHPLTALESGMYLRNNPAVLAAQQHAGDDAEQGVRIYSVHRPHESHDKWNPVLQTREWVGHRRYPHLGPALLFGQDEIEHHLGTQMSEGGQRLTFIWASVAGHPGFDFIKDIEATGEKGSDTQLVEAWADRDDR